MTTFRCPKGCTVTGDGEPCPHGYKYVRLPAAPLPDDYGCSRDPQTPATVPWQPTRYGPNRHLHRHAADLWATPLADLREALTDLTRAVLHVMYDHTLGRRHRGRET